MPDVWVAKSFSDFRCAERASRHADRRNAERLTMRPLRSPRDDFEIRAHTMCRWFSVEPIFQLIGASPAVIRMPSRSTWQA